MKVLQAIVFLALMALLVFLTPFAFEATIYKVSAMFR